jgi:hypothetical protein
MPTKLHRRNYYSRSKQSDIKQLPTPEEIFEEVFETPMPELPNNASAGNYGKNPSNTGASTFKADVINFDRAMPEDFKSSSNPKIEMVEQKYTKDPASIPASQQVVHIAIQAPQNFRPDDYKIPASIANLEPSIMLGDEVITFDLPCPQNQMFYPSNTCQSKPQPEPLVNKVQPDKLGLLKQLLPVVMTKIVSGI